MLSKWIIRIETSKLLFRKKMNIARIKTKKSDPMLCIHNEPKLLVKQYKSCSTKIAQAINKPKTLI